MSIISKVIAPFIEPITGIVNKAVKDKDLATKLNHDIIMALVGADTTHMKEASANIRAEINSESWLSSNWRPLTMLTFVALICAYWFGFAPDYLVENPSVVSELFSLVKLGLGGYVIGRSGEKIVKSITQNGGIKALTK